MYKLGDMVKCICDPACRVHGKLVDVFGTIHIVLDAANVSHEIEEEYIALIKLSPSNSKLNSGGNV